MLKTTKTALAVFALALFVACGSMPSAETETVDAIVAAPDIFSLRLAPVSLSGADVDSLRVKIEWFYDPADPISQFKIEAKLATTNPPNLSCADPLDYASIGTAPATTYEFTTKVAPHNDQETVCYRVIAQSAGGASAWDYAPKRGISKPENAFRGSCGTDDPCVVATFDGQADTKWRFEYGVGLFVTPTNTKDPNPLTAYTSPALSNGHQVTWRCDMLGVGGCPEPNVRILIRPLRALDIGPGVIVDP